MRLAKTPIDIGPRTGDYAPNGGETKRVQIGDLYAALNNDGTITIGCAKMLPTGQFSLGEGKIPGMSREDLQDLLVALDSVTNEASDPNPKTWAEQIPREAMSLARNVYAWTASKATVELTVSSDVWHSMAAEYSPFTGNAAWEAQNGLLRCYDGSVMVRRRTH